MFAMAQIVTVFFLCLLIWRRAKLESKKLLIVLLLVVSYASDFIVDKIPLPSDVVTVTALGIKNEDSNNYEVYLKNFQVAGEQYNIDEVESGKWKLHGENNGYMWRIETDTRQPDGVTRELRFEIPKGLDRYLQFQKQKWSGFAEIEVNDEVITIDLYSEDSENTLISIPDTSSDEMYLIKFLLLTLWILLTLFILFIIQSLRLCSKKYPKHSDQICITSIIILQLLLCTYYAFQKEGYHTDETYTKETSNGYSSYHLQNESDYYNIWQENNYYIDAFTVDESELFDYTKLFLRFDGHVHPPLYYFFYHTVSSLRVGTMSDLVGFSINYLFFILSSIQLFSISKLILKEKTLIFLPNVLWGGSIVAISNVMFFRMYTLLTFTTLFFIYTYLKYVYLQLTIPKKGMIICLIATYLGCMSHYYFIVFAFLFTLFVCLEKLISKDFVNMVKYGLCSLCGVLLMFITYPYSISALLKSSRGSQAIENAFDLSRISVNLESFVQLIYEQLFGDLIGRLVIATAVVIYFFLFINRYICRISLKSENKQLILSLEWITNSTICIPLKKHREHFIYTLLFLIVTFFLIIVSLVAPYQEIRYISGILPVLSILFIYVMSHLTTILQKNVSIRQTTIFTIIFLIVSYNLLFQEPNYLYSNQSYMGKIARENSNLSCVYLSSETYHRTDHHIYFAEYNSSLMIKTSNIEQLSALIAEKDGERDKLILYLNDSSLLEQVMDILGYKTSEKLTTFAGESIYRLSNLN